MMSKYLALALLLGLVACGDGSTAAPEAQQTASTTPSSTPSASFLSIPLDDGPPLEPGTYLVSKAGRTGSDPLVWSIVDFTIEIPQGLIGHTGHYLETTRDFPRRARFGFYPLLVDEIYADPCEGERGSTLPVGPKPGDLVKALRAQAGTAASRPVKTVIGGLPATRVDLEVPEGADLRSCHMADYGPPALQIWFSKPSGKYFVLSPDLHARVYVVDVDAERQVFVAAHSVEASDKDLRVLQSMIDSIRFQP